jgi:hypothetical protein
MSEDKKIEHFMQYVSLDSVFEQAEYIRNGLDFNRLWHNVNRFLVEVPYRSSLTFIITMNNLSVPKFQNFMYMILGLRMAHSQTYQRVWFDTPLLRKPDWQSLQILPEIYADKLEETWAFMMKNLETPDDPFKGFKDYELQRLDRDIAWMREGSNLDPEYVKLCKANFYRFFNEYDKRHEKNFLTTFPEMAEWWRECEYYAKTT